MKTIAIYHTDSDYVCTLVAHFQTALPNHNVVAWEKNTSAEYLIAWKPKPELFATPNLQIIFALGAGIDAFIGADLPDNIHLVRLEEAGMGKQMLEVALYGILHYSRDMITLNRGQREKQWLNYATPKRLPFSTPIGVMGLGQLGGFVAESLAKLGYSVSGYSRTDKAILNVTCYSGDNLDTFLAKSEVLINLLPLTAHTENILNQDNFAKLPKGAFLINIARGKHLCEEDLLSALNSGQLSGALLDVFRTEPLPIDHPFWTDDRITIMPHIAAITTKDEAIRQISNNIIAFENATPMTGVVDRKRGY